jgi:hypothetical protein
MARLAALDAAIHAAPRQSDLSRLTKIKSFTALRSLMELRRLLQRYNPWMAGTSQTSPAMTRNTRRAIGQNANQ